RWMESVVPWVTYGLLWGRPIVASIGWVWSVVGMFLLVYLLVNLVAHEPVSTTAGVLAARPFGSFMTGLLVLLLAGPVSALLAVSIIGIAVIPFALAALVVAGLVGRVGVLRWLGNTVLPSDDATSRVQGLRAFAIGFALVTLTYMVPLLGLVAWALFGLLGLGAAVLAFLMAWRREHPRVEKPARVRRGAAAATPPQEPLPSAGYAYAAPAAAAFSQNAGFGSGPATFAGPEATGWQAPADSTDPEGAASFAVGGGAAAAAIPNAFTSDLALFPRAAFLDRAAAFVIDVVLVLFVSRLLDQSSRYRYGNDDWMFPLLLAYFIAFWAWKGTTIGGIVTNLRVVKINGGDLSFLESLVRGLTSVLSFGALGIGVLWILRSDLVAADGRPARQAWHDLAAGTYVVKVPKGYPLP
ncbi:MAG: RDD family protein, partial [Vicinamibacterales bacterium]